jgi:hypothetical protein
MYVITCVPVQLIYEINSCIYMPIRCYELCFQNVSLILRGLHQSSASFQSPGSCARLALGPLLVFTFSSPFIACFHKKILFSPLFHNYCLCCANTQPLAVSYPTVHSARGLYTDLGSSILFPVSGLFSSMWLLLLLWRAGGSRFLWNSKFVSD